MSRLDQLQIQFRERLKLENVCFTASEKRETRPSVPERVIRRPTKYQSPASTETVASHPPTTSVTRPTLKSKYSNNALNKVTTIPKRSNESHSLANPTSKSLAAPRQLTTSSKQTVSPAVTIASKATISRKVVKDPPKDLSCAICSRTFALADRLATHQEICAKTTTKVRKRFDSTKQRFKNQPKDFIAAYQNSLKVCCKYTYFFR